jgi:hypothetical protein
VTPPARNARPPVAGIGGQRLPEHAATELQQPGPQDGLGRAQAGIAAAQRPGRLSCQAAYLGGLLLRKGGEEPPFSPSGAEGSSRAADGLASQIASLTSTIRSASDANFW